MSGPIRNQNAKIYRANSANLIVAVTQADGTPYDPSLNAIVRYRVARTSYASEEESLIKKELGDGIENTADGLSILIDSVDSDLPPGVYYQEVRVWDGGDVATAMVGALILKQALTMGIVSLEPPMAVIRLSGSVPVLT